jgi:hypothetical protein
LAHAERFAVGDDDAGVVQEPVEEADGGGVLGQEPPPLVEGPVGGDAQGAAFVGGGDQAEQQLGAGVIQRGEADLVDLCGSPHSWTYADPATMPMLAGPA